MPDRTRVPGSFIIIAACAGLASMAGDVADALAQGEPRRPVRLLVPSPPGGPSDFVARLVAPKLGESLGQLIVVDNRSSTNGIIASEIGARAAPDGNTLLIGNVGTLVMNTGLYRKLSYDPQRDFVPISQLVSAGTALVATPKFAPNTLRELIAAAKKEPGRINIAVAGAAGVVQTEFLKHVAGIDLNNIPYKGSSPTEVAVLSGEVSIALMSIPVVTPHVKAGRMKIYGVTTAKRSRNLPEVPTIQEQGFADFEFGNWHGLLAPAGTPQAVVRKAHEAVVNILNTPEIREIVESRGNEVIANSPQAFAANLKRDIPRFGKIMAIAGIVPQ